MSGLLSWRARDRALTALMLCASVLTGCHSHKHIAIVSVPDPSATPAPSIPLKVGDEVRIILRNGDGVHFKVAEVQADALLGDTGRRVLYRDMQSLKKRHLSTVKTGILVGVLAFWIALVIAIAASGDFIPAGV